MCNVAKNLADCFFKNFLLAYVNTDSVHVKFLEHNLKFLPCDQGCNILHVRTTQPVVMYMDYFHTSFSHSSFSGSILMTSSSDVKKCRVASLLFYTLHKTLR
jgi:hypothetical protein